MMLHIQRSVKSRIAQRVKSNFRVLSTQVNADSISETSAKSVKEYGEIPGPKDELPFLGSLWKIMKTQGGFQAFLKNLNKEYGDIVKYSVFGVKRVAIFRPDLIKDIYTSNQSTPLREAPLPWVMYRQAKKIPLGVAMALSQIEQNEESWRKFRRPVAHLLNPAIAKSYIPRISLVGLDLADTFRATNGKPLSVAEVRQVTSNYGFEAITAILMGKSMGVLGIDPEKTDPIAKRFMNAIDRWFRTSDKLLFREYPLWQFFPTKTRREHYQASDEFFKLGEFFFAKAKENKDPRFVNDGIKDFFDVIDEEQANTSGTPLTPYERKITGIELIAAGVDTTSNSAMWALLFMAQHPEIQETLAKKLKEVVGPLGTRIPITAEHIKEAQLNLYIEEILRIHPTLPTGSRMFSKEVELCGYKIPAFTRINLVNWVTSKDERNYKDPMSFDITRSVRKECPFGNKTFGAGARQCPGERVARAELAVLLGTTIHQFKIASSDTSEYLTEEAKLLMSPSDSIKAKFAFIPH